MQTWTLLNSFPTFDMAKCCVFHDFLVLANRVVYQTFGDLISPISPINSNKKLSSPQIEPNHEENEFVHGVEFDFDKSDTASDAGTYTLDADNYTEEQKARMSIDREFKIEQISLKKKTEEYVRSLAQTNDTSRENKIKNGKDIIVKGVQSINLSDSECSSIKSPTVRQKFVHTPHRHSSVNKVLSPILSPTQNVSITDSVRIDPSNNEDIDLDNTCTRIVYPSATAKRDGLAVMVDQGTVISVTSSGAFRSKSDQQKTHQRKWSLSKSEIQVQAYIDDKIVQEEIVSRKPTPNLSTSIVNVQNIQTNSDQNGKTSPSKIPSPIHTMSRPRSRNGLNIDLSDTSLDTEVILKPTQNYINSLQQRLSLDSDQDSDYDTKFGIKLNNTAHLLKQKASHTRHNSLDDRTMNNKLEHFHNKSLLQNIDQTYSNLLNQYGTPNKYIHKIQNSPNNSPIKRSSSFSTKNQFNTKNTNIITQKEINLCNSPSSIQRSSSTACIRPNYIPLRRSSITQDHQKIDRNQFGDTESSSEEDYEKMAQKRANITNTRCNRAFSLRRARLDEPQPPIKCPNTPEMRRKLVPENKMERAISMDRKPMKTNEVQSRYLQNISKRTPTNAGKCDLLVKNVPKTVTTSNVTKTNLTKTPTFSRTDSGRFSMRVGNSKPPVSNSAKGLKKDAGGKGKKGSGARSNSSLSSREVEFQNWKRRKSYDPMKAAAEGKKKEMAKRQTQNIMTQSYTESNHSQDSSPSHSSSVHRSQSFHGTAALEHHLISSEDEDFTLSADEGFSPPTPSPCELSPARASLRHSLWDRIHH